MLGKKENKSPAFQFYARDFLADMKVQLMSMEQRGMYITLLSYAWIENGIPNDPRSFVETSGIRIGTAAETTRGHDKQWFNNLANNISNILNN